MDYLREYVYPSIIERGEFDFTDPENPELPHSLGRLVKKCIEHPGGFACSAYKPVKGLPINQLINQINQVRDEDQAPFKENEFIIKDGALIWIKHEDQRDKIMND